MLETELGQISHAQNLTGAMNEAFDIRVTSSVVGAGTPRKEVRGLDGCPDADDHYR